MTEREEENSRRIFLNRLLVSGVALVAGGLSVVGCGNTEKPKTAEKKEGLPERFGGNCGDFSKMKEADFEAREKLGYVDESPAEDTQCQICNLWLPPRENETCGGCTLFTGPINPKGTCTYWAPRQS